MGGQTNDDRVKATHAEIMSEVIKKIRVDMGHEVSRVWLVGTSAGTLSALNTAARYPLMTVQAGDPDPNTGRPNGIVLTSTLTEPSTAEQCTKTIDYFVAPNPKATGINVPAVVIWNLQDICPCTPGATNGGPAPDHANVAQQVVTKLGSTFGGPKRTGKTFNAPTNPNATSQCAAKTAHGFLGIDNDVVAYIASQIPH